MICARDIADALGGIPALAKVCGVQYRLAYGYVDRDSIPAVHDLNILRALEAANSKIDALQIAEWRAASAKNDKNCHPPVQDKAVEQSVGGAQA